MRLRPLAERCGPLHEQTADSSMHISHARSQAQGLSPTSASDESECGKWGPRIKASSQQRTMCRWPPAAAAADQSQEPRASHPSSLEQSCTCTSERCTALARLQVALSLSPSSIPTVLVSSDPSPPPSPISPRPTPASSSYPDPPLPPPGSPVPGPRITTPHCSFLLHLVTCRLAFSTSAAPLPSVERPAPPSPPAPRRTLPNH